MDNCLSCNNTGVANGQLCGRCHRGRELRVLLLAEAVSKKNLKELRHKHRLGPEFRTVEALANDQGALLVSLLGSGPAYVTDYTRNFAEDAEKVLGGANLEDFDGVMFLDLADKETYNRVAFYNREQGVFWNRELAHEQMPKWCKEA
jgi:hypothetical protein